MIKFKTPVARIVQGELWKQRAKKDKAGATIKDAAGNDRMQRYFAVAVPKQPGHQHWNQTDWGRQVWDEGVRAHQQFAQHPQFSWKIEDGDSQVPNKKMKKNCDREGHPGHWIIKFSTEFSEPIPTYNANGSATMPGEAFKPGMWVEVFGSVKGNTGDTAGVYMNPLMVALAGYGLPIETESDPSEAGFGQSALPPGASAVPLASTTLTPPAAALPGMQPAAGTTFSHPVTLGVPMVPAAVLPQSAVPLSQVAPQVAGSAGSTPTTSLSSPVQVAVQPNPAFLLGPLAPIVPAVPALSAAALAAGHTYANLRAAGHTDDALRAAGYLA
jgi:hypothetical protein